jgi:propionyl-CoA carboxylase alpha chain
VLYLNERECSIQRRHQKVVEEAPSPFVTPKMRKAMGEQCVALSKAVNYHSAGTVELIVSGADKTGESFYFLEMNTRLQVEHPVTEAITGIDLVEQMIRVAAGEKLEMTQDDIGIDGWAIENRVYAEDPYRGFLPSTGRLVEYEPPVEGWTDDGSANGRRGVEGVRVDDGVYEGGEVSMFYDPMIAKLVTWGETRDEAADLQIQALDAFRIKGLGHNVDFLSAIMQHPRFRSGELTTGFIAEEYPEGFEGAPASDRLKGVLAAVGGVIATADADRARRIDQQLDGHMYAPGDWSVRIGEVEENSSTHEVRLEEEAITVDGSPVPIELSYTPGDRFVHVDLFDEDADEDADPVESFSMQLKPTLTGYAITTRGSTHHLRILPQRVAHLAQYMIEKEPPDLSKMLICPMPGLLVKLHVTEGEEVQPGQPLATVEAMKMENILRAEKEGTIAKINAGEGDSLAVDEIILELE